MSDSPMKDGIGALTAEEWIDRGCDLFDDGEFEEAAAAFAQGVSMGAAWAGLNLGNALSELRRWNDAVAAYEVAIAAGELSARLNLANLLSARLSDLEGALHHYMQAWQEGDAAAAVGLATMAEEEGDDAALEWLHRALAKNVPQARWRLGEALSRRGEHQQAMRYLDEAVDVGEEGARIARALALRRMGDPHGAEKELLQALASGDEQAALFLAQLAAESGAEKTARQWYERAIQSDPDAIFEYALFLQDAARNPLEAVAMYERAAGTGDFRAHLNLASLWLELDRPEDARREYGLAKACGDKKAKLEFELWSRGET